MEFIDTHTHLYEEGFRGEESQAVERALEAGVSKMVFPDIDSTSRDDMFSLSERFPGTVFPCLGLHPTSVGAGWKKAIEEMEGYMDRKIVAIGETGMDCYWSKEFIQEQKDALEYQIVLAHRKNLPIIIHSRDATGLIFDVLEKCRNLDMRGVFHAFSGSVETFRRLQKYGRWYVGIGGVVTYKNASIAETVKEIPLEYILLETDSPYLTPVPKRGTRNESSYIPYIARKLADLKGLSIEEIASATTSNARQLFNI
ncbi:MAG: TatD family hydrolase [Bacteroidetes bacterium]|uniref:TatD family hydrolase n=1 Tax=Candidatus Cryptobacteroides faecipullorum TaxID=2840764 RepID=A0A9D9NBU4_9BACT|nr:TatD family hydrolase [Candidatus Cryptobacteroides faecipullorum]